MTREEIIERVKGFVSGAAVVEVREIRMDDHLEHDLGLDSLDVSELELNIESDLCLDLEGRSQGWFTVADICDSVAKALSTPA